MQQLSSRETTLHRIPHDWKTVRLQEIATINPESIAKDYPYEEIEYIDIGSIENYQISKYEHFSLNKRPSRAQRIVKRNDIIVSTVRPYLHGFTKIIDSMPNLVCSTGFAVLRCHDSKLVDFIFSFIKSGYFESQLNIKMTGLAYPAVTSRIVGNTLLGFPKNKNEVQKIGNILSKVDELIQKTEQIIEQTQRLKKGLVQKLLTKGIGHTVIKQVYEEWIIKIAYPILKTKVETYSQKLGVHVQKILVKSNLKSRWASLTRKESINFNMNLIKAPQDVIDYIVLHEICHLKIKGHSHHYWDLVYRYMPNYQDKINWLNVNGRVLISK